MKTLRPIFFFSSLLLIVGLACSALGGGDTPTAQPQQPVQEQPTQPPAPVVTEAPPTEAPVTEAPVTEAPIVSQTQQFFTEEFDSPLSGDWDILTVTGDSGADPDKVTVDSSDGKLVWDFDSKYVYYYLFYNAFTYEDVKVDVRADNRGKNNNSVSLICRYDAEIGWYEFNIANSGLYQILYAEVTSDGSISYNIVADGGSTSIHLGKDINEYSITCKGQQLTLFINGKETRSVAEKKFNLREGQIGMSVSSFDVLPILIEMDYFKISEP